jgi:hypothetical protein
MGKHDQAKKELKDARKKLNGLPKTGDETPEYRAANDDVIQAEQALPWWRR